MKTIEFEGGGIDVSEDRVYVLHLPTCWDRAVGQATKTTVTSPAHERERLRFERDVWAHLEQNGVRKVVLEAARRAEHALLELDSLLNAREGVLRAVMERDDKAAPVLADKFHEGRDLAEAVWSRAYNDEVVEGVAHVGELGVQRAQVEQARAAVRSLQARLEMVCKSTAPQVS